jgi:hypothetical protein
MVCSVVIPSILWKIEKEVILQLRVYTDVKNSTQDSWITTLTLDSKINHLPTSMHTNRCYRDLEGSGRI